LFDGWLLPLVADVLLLLVELLLLFVLLLLLLCGGVDIETTAELRSEVSLLGSSLMHHFDDQIWMFFFF